MNTHPSPGATGAFPGVSPASIAIVIAGEPNSPFLARTLESVQQQSGPAACVVLALEGLSPVQIARFQQRFPGLAFRIANFQKAGLPLDVPPEEYTIVMAPGDRFETHKALQEYRRAFQAQPAAVMCIPGLRLTSNTGREIERAVISDGRPGPHPSDLLAGPVYLSGGRGIAFRSRSLCFVSGEGLWEGLVRLAQSGMLLRIDTVLFSAVRCDLPPLAELTRQYHSVLRKHFPPRHIKEAAAAWGHYHRLASTHRSQPAWRALGHRLASRALQPAAMLHDLRTAAEETGVRLLFLLSGALGRACFSFRILRRAPTVDEQRFALVSHVLPPAPSGQSVVIERLLRGVDPLRYSLILTGSPGSSDGNIPPLAAAVHTVRSRPPFSRLQRFFPLFFLTGFAIAFGKAWAIARIARRHGCRHLVGCTGELNDPPAAALAARFLGGDFFAYYFDDYRYQWAASRWRRYAARMEAVLLRQATGVIVPNPLLEQEILRRRFGRVRVVPNPADEPPETEKTGIPLKPKRIVFSGSVYDVNGEAIARVAQAVEQLAHLDIELHLYTSQAAQVLAHYAIGGSRLFVHPHTTPEALQQVHQEAFLLLVPYAHQSRIPEVIHTSSPAKFGDYLQSGTPLLVFAPPGIFVHRYIADHGCGIAVTDDSVEVVKSAIEDLAAHPDQYQAMTSRARQAAAADYSRPASQAAFMEFLENRAPEHGVLHVSSTDLAGAAFNGLLLSEQMKGRGFRGYLSVAEARSSYPYVYAYGGGAHYHLTNRVIRTLLNQASIQSLFPTYTVNRMLPNRLWETEIDVVHLQVIHAAPFFNLDIIPQISRQYPTVWTLHDQWAYTGHCLHPMECDGWLSGCRPCPYLGRNIAMKHDRAAFMFKKKHEIFRRSRLQLVVASQWMAERVKQSPIVQHLPCRVIPFGIDADVFYPEEKGAAKASFNLPPGGRVVACLATADNIYKGMPYMRQALDASRAKDVTLIHLGGRGGFSEYRGKFNLIELDWVADPNLLRRLLSAADLFVAPSIAESFGMLPLESLACGTPCLVFADTALAEITHAPEIGAAVPYRDGSALGGMMDALLDDPQELARRGQAGTELVRTHYPLTRYVGEHLALYKDMIDQFKGTPA